MIYVYCEGQTEETFINEVLAPYMFYMAGLSLKPIVCETKRTSLKKYKGGIVDYQRVKKEIQRLCKEHHNEYVTSMMDFYSFPEETPGMDKALKLIDVYERVEYIESEIKKDIGCENFIPHLMLHEFEALIFVRPELLTQYYQKHSREIERLITLREEAETPEHIDLGKDTAPSKRIKFAIPEYDKIVAGTAITLDIGMDRIIEECRHFAAWIYKICLLKDK